MGVLRDTVAGVGLTTGAGLDEVFGFENWFGHVGLQGWYGLLRFGTVCITL